MKITKQQLKQIIKEELEQVEQEQEFSEEPPDTSSTMQSISSKLMQMTDTQLAKIDSWLMGLFGDDSPEAEWRQPFGKDVEDLPQQDPTYKYSGSSPMGESIDRDKMATLVAEEVRKILKNK